MTAVVDVPPGCDRAGPARAPEIVRPPVLEVDRLSVVLRGDGGVRPVIDDVSFTVRPGEVVALVGESGCGKSVTALAVMRLLPPAMATTSGRVVLDGRDMTALSERALQSVRGRVVSLVFQDPMSSLNPLMTVGAQVAEALIVHGLCSAREARARAVDLLGLVRIPSPRDRAKEYPHRLSGGMRQRVMIAIALACEPKLIIADEPTTALDVTIQRQIVDLLRELQAKRDIGLLLITHDVGLVSELADRVTVMYAGRVVEQATVPDLLRGAAHPYTRALLRAMPSFSRDARTDGRTRLVEIGGVVPSLGERPTGCAFRPRCPVSIDDCARVVPPLVRAGPDHRAACLLVEEARP